MKTTPGDQRKNWGDGFGFSDERRKGPGLKPVLASVRFRWTEVQLPPTEVGGSHRKAKAVSLKRGGTEANAPVGKWMERCYDEVEPHDELTAIRRGYRIECDSWRRIGCVGNWEARVAVEQQDLAGSCGLEATRYSVGT